ncbi:hypothetical protein PAXINDRAFT_27756, partial [Paxillus involutus ATCC 200175]
DRYEAFLRMSQQWRHLKMVKRAGRGHEPHGLGATAEGECAVLCPACPHPGKNLPSNFHEASLEERWIYGLFIAIDTNFRLKRKKVSKDSVDPSLSKGWAYFVEESAYKAHLESNNDTVQEKSTCSSHNTVNMADTKSNHSLAATGVGTVDCARHNMKLPTAVGDLQKGEKYVNMHYLVLSTLCHNSVDVLNISYDIACQWSKNLWQRVARFPLSMQLSHHDKHVTYFVPKFHLPAHIAKCQTTFSFNFRLGVGRTDGEAPERGWANINPAVSSTKEMGPGARRDILDDHFGHWNWKKVTLLRKMLLQKLKDTIPKRCEHRDALEELQAGLQEDHAEHVARWKVEVEAWESDPSKPNPLERSGETITLAAVHLELANEEAKDVGAVVLHEDCSASVLISTGLELKESQRRLKSDKAGQGIHATDNQEAKLVQRSNALQRCIDTWVKLQHLFMPVLSSARAKDAQNVEVVIPPDTFNLCLPSQIGWSFECPEMLQKIEWKLCYAQAHDALHSLRSNLRARSYVLKYKDRHLQGQGANTRAWNMLKGIEGHIEAMANKYGDAHKALVVLAPLLKETNWHVFFFFSCHLTRLIYNTDMRIEWCKARARAKRWEEEVKLLLEEMRRANEFFLWEAKQWDERGEPFSFEREWTFSALDEADLEGYRAYAKRQSALHRALAARNSSSWD